ncbi:MerR family transcriptional regulator [Streptomyces sp. S3(2020)]|uniref:MerR family transcriptional regulator n=1 Tax=Streptomyces sp. S3(2020) TaxID=2732044 RepID=UPI0014887EB8|nr:MerR family transcriptional regulator [Streptomyces sp. S3(2020)]NNN29788.1 MerR family transcriptional regulator [Streptomyces sp. S3(2020)]
MRSTEETLSIGALARRFGLEPHVLRHWESVGLLAPDRDTAGRRRYGADDLVRVAFVLCGKEAGLSLEAIRLMATGDGERRRALLRREAEDLRARIAAARAALAMLEGGADCPHEDLLRCPTFRRGIARQAVRIGEASPRSPVLR